MSKQSGRWTLSAEDFERERSRLDKARAAMVIEQSVALEEFALQYDRLDQLQRDVAEMAERYPVKPGRRKIADVGRPKPATPRRPTPSRPVPSGPRWTPEEDERLLSDDEGQVELLARERGVSRYAITKRQKYLRLQQQNAAPETPAPIETTESQSRAARSAGDRADLPEVRDEPVSTGAAGERSQARPQSIGGTPEMSARLGSETPEVVEPTPPAPAAPENPPPVPEAKPSAAHSRPDDGRISPTLQDKLHGYAQPERHPQRHPAIKDESSGFIRAPSKERLMGGR